jgi:hypothetical protein
MRGAEGEGTAETEFDAAFRHYGTRNDPLCQSFAYVNLKYFGDYSASSLRMILQTEPTV